MNAALFTRWCCSMISTGQSANTLIRCNYDNCALLTTTLILGGGLGFSRSQTWSAISRSQALLYRSCIFPSLTQVQSVRMRCECLRPGLHYNGWRDLVYHCRVIEWWWWHSVSTWWAGVTMYTVTTLYHSPIVKAIIIEYHLWKNCENRDSLSASAIIKRTLW